MPLCNKCGTDNPADVDFCSGCGEYLRWEATGFQPAVETPAPPAQPAPTPVAGVAPPQAAVPGPYEGAAAPAAPTPAAPAAQDQAPAAPPDAVLVALRMPDDDGYAGGDVSPRVEPGGRTAIVALVRNQSGIVDNYDLLVDGMPESWWTIAPATVYLVPYGAGGGAYEQEVEITFHPPRAAEAEARAWEIQIKANSRAYGQTMTVTEVTVEVAPFQQLEADLNPERGSGRVRADFTVGVTNRSNAAVEVLLGAVDPESACQFSFHEAPQAARKGAGDGLDSAAKGMRQAQYLGVGAGADFGLDPRLLGQRALQQVTSGDLGPLKRLLRGKKLPPAIGGLHLEPGDRAEALLSVSPPKQVWFGRPTLHPFQVTVQPVGSEAAGPPVAGQYRQKPWLPWWLLIVIPLVIALIILLLSMRQAQATVPDLAKAKDRLELEGLLQQSKLVLGNVTEEVNDQVKAGAVLGQEPPAGAKVKAGSPVAVKVAVGSGKVPVPELKGMTLTQAAAALAAASLTRGPDLVAPADPNTAVVDSSVPAAGTSAPTGSAVQLVFAAPQPVGGQGTPGAPGVLPGGQGAPTGQGGAPSAGGGAPSAGGGGAGAGGGGAGAASLVVPGLVGKKQAEAATALVGAGLVPVLRSQYSDEVPAGQIIAQAPEGGSKAAKGGRVTLAVSAGIPNVIFSLDGDIVSATRSSGKLVATPLAASEQVEDQPTLARNGRLLAFRRGPDANSGQIWLMDVNDPRTARPITSAGFNDRRPAFAPTTQGQPVVAFSSNRGGAPNDTNLCFITLDRPQPPVQCIVDPAQQLSRPAWSPDGRSIVATVNDNNQDELALFTSNVPFSGNPADWVKQGIATDQMHGQRPGDRVFSSAFSPDGTQLAISANWGGSPKVWLIPVQGGQLGQTATAVSLISACELAWRPDGGELAVSQRTGSSDCTGKGQIARVDPRAPGDQIILTTGLVNASDPVWALTAG